MAQYTHGSIQYTGHHWWVQNASPFAILPCKFLLLAAKITSSLSLFKYSCWLRESWCFDFIIHVRYALWRIYCASLSAWISSRMKPFIVLADAASYPFIGTISVELHAAVYFTRELRACYAYWWCFINIWKNISPAAYIDGGQKIDIYFHFHI